MNDLVLICGGANKITEVSHNEHCMTCGEGLIWIGKRKGQFDKVLFVKITVK